MSSTAIMVSFSFGVFIGVLATLIFWPWIDDTEHQDDWEKYE